MNERLHKLQSSPYVSRMGVRFDDHGDELTAILPYDEWLIGNPLIPALHGGAIGAFMEITASAGLLAFTELAAQLAVLCTKGSLAGSASGPGALWQQPRNEI